jgi:hypothetical protein
MRARNEALRFLVIATVMALVACEPVSEPQTAVPQTRNPREIAETAVGSPTAAPVSKAIGPEGGEIASIDGKFTLSIPPNAVPAMTTFAVTPIQTTSPGGFISYRLSPEGTTFANNATLTFQYSEEDVAGSQPSLLNIVYQDVARQWRSSATTVDEAAKTVSTRTKHLSDWSVVRTVVLRPSSAVVRVKQSVALTLQICTVSPSIEDDEEAPLSKCIEYDEDIEPYYIRGPYVENQIGGSALLGRVTTGSRFSYTAPKKEPSPNPVAVSVDLFRRDRGATSKTILLSMVKVVQDDKEYPDDNLPQKYSGSGRISVSSGGQGTGSSLLNYNATFEVSGGRAAGGGTGEYTLPGTLSISDGAMELPNCQCTITGGEATAEAGLGVGESDQQQSLAVSAYVTVGISCTPTAGRRKCPSTTVIPVSWSNNGAPHCPGSSITTFDNVRMLTGGYQRTCGNRTETANWKLTGE